MANLFTDTINTAGEYITLAELSDLTFTVGTTYTIQILHEAHLREGTTGKGFLICSPKPIEYTAGSDDLYICTDYHNCTVNISE